MARFSIMVGRSPYQHTFRIRLCRRDFSYGKQTPPGVQVVQSRQSPDTHRIVGTGASVYYD